MEVGVNLATEIKAESEKRNMDFSRLLMDYMKEDVLDKIYSGKYSDKFWVVAGTSGDKRREDRIEVYYSDMKKPLSEEIIEAALKPLYDSKEISWMYNIRKADEGFVTDLFAEYRQMQIPLAIVINPLKETGINPEEKQWKRILQQGKTIKYWCYSPESKMSGCLRELLDKLELIGSMEAYYVVNDILKEYPVSGRHIMEELGEYAQKNPRFLKQKRIEQIESYKDYTYMRKKWIQYEKRNQLEPEPWEEVVDRIMSFLQPIWGAMCRNEIFFDDWMPELGRFLG